MAYMQNTVWSTLEIRIWAYHDVSLYTRCSAFQSYAGNSGACLDVTDIFGSNQTVPDLGYAISIWELSSMLLEFCWG